MTNTLTSFFDGSCRKASPRDSDGAISAAWLIESDPPRSGLVELGQGSIHIAEFGGLLALLEQFRGVPPGKIYVCGDDATVIYLVTREWQTVQPHLLDLLWRAHRLIAELEWWGTEVNMVHVGRRENRAHALLHPPKPPRLWAQPIGPKRRPGRPRKISESI
jgi:ribonuclease HI